MLFWPTCVKQFNLAWEFIEIAENICSSQQYTSKIESLFKDMPSYRFVDSLLHRNIFFVILSKCSEMKARYKITVIDLN